MADFELKADPELEARLRAEVEASIQRKRDKLYTEEELQRLLDLPLESFPPPSALEGIGLEQELERLHQTENIDLKQDKLYRSHPGPMGRAIEWLRYRLRPVVKLFFNLDVLFPEFHKQWHLNHRYGYLHELQIRLIARLVRELTLLKLEHEQLRGRFESVLRSLDLLQVRHQALEELAVLKELPPEQRKLPEPPLGGEEAVFEAAAALDHLDGKAKDD